jgi:Vault protein inter-alpha-trypsin domain
MATVIALPQARSFRFDDKQAWTEAPAVAAPPLDLTASDGTGLVLAALSARAVIDDPLAFTELHLTFQNPEARQLEGRFRIALPPGATVSRFAMRIGSGWQEGEVVERQAARRAYEDFLHRRQDPALLEQEAGNEFSARVFPIEARARKEIIVSYSHELTRPGAAYRLPLVGLPAIERLEVRALVGKSESQAVGSLGATSASWQVVEVRKSQWRPDADFEVPPTGPARDGLRHENLAVVRVVPGLPVAPDEIGSLLVLIDASASRALGFARQVALVEELAAALARGAGPQVPLAVACFDQAVEVVYEGQAGGFDRAAAARLGGRRAFGASDLAGALTRVASETERRYDRVLVITDGVATAGDATPEAIAAAARALGAAGVRRLDALALGGLRDDAVLRRLVTAGLPSDGTVCDGDRPAAEVAQRLVRATRSGIRVEVPGASWVWPTRLDAMQPGDAALVYADVPAGAPVRVVVDGTPSEPQLAAAERPLVERAWIRARIEKLEELRGSPDCDPDVRDGLKKQIIELSTRHRVLSPYTALLVLETEGDYARAGIDRRALADILTVGAGGVEVLHRSAASLPPMVPAPPPSTRGKGGPKAETAEQAEKAKKVARREDRDDDVDAMGFSELAHDNDFAGDEAPGAPFEARSQEMAGALMMDADMEDSDMPTFGSASRSFDAEEMGASDAESSAPAAAPAAAPAPAPAPAPMRTRSATTLMSPPPPPRAAAPAPASPAPPSILRRVVDVFRPSPEPAPMPPPAAAPPPGPPAGPAGADAWTGPFREVMEHLGGRRTKQALERALAWRDDAPGDVLALVAVGEAAEALDDPQLAARAYGSLIDLYPSRADLRRFAGERLERLDARAALELAADSYRKAVESRPDHPSGHHLLAMALLRLGRAEEAFHVLVAASARSYPPRFPAVDRILAEDLGLAAAAWIRREPARQGEILGLLARAGGHVEDAPSVRFVLVWETDANDVDFHIHDAKGGHAYYRDKVLASGGELYADVTQGYGPECFTIRAPPAARAYPYRLQAHYFSRGPMGYGMGTLAVIEHDGRGGLAFDERPYVVMQDRAFVELGTVERALAIG